VAIVGVSACNGESTLKTPWVTSVIITGKQTIAVGEAAQLTTTARDVNGVPISYAKISFASLSAAVVSVNSTGRIIGVAPGSASIVATSGVVSSQPYPITVTAGAVAAVITMQANTFTPSQVTVRAGQSILFDFPADQHNVIFAARAGKPADIPTTSSKAVAVAFPTAGTFPFDCTLHPGMSGTVVVNP
jgi:plastocyanin